MLFNSIAFLLFFPIVCLVYWLLPLNRRNIWLLLSSFFFYMNWEPAYALLMLFTIASTWTAALYIDREGVHRKQVFVVAVLANLFILFLYKYADFFSANIMMVLDSCGVRLSIPQFRYLLPVGISFYTFQAIGYLVDVYKRKSEALTDFKEYALFISFFPQLVAGPIERVQHMIPQFRSRHQFSYKYVESGCLVMLWGYFLKLCMADRCAIYVDAVFDNLPMHNGGSYLLASLLFPFQIYGDFCGYSLIAVGTARIMGFNMMNNFRNPYFSVSIADFWTRWHISLSSFLRDYLYIPLGGSRNGTARTYRNLMVTMLVSGLWHGANWTFVVWGGFHGACMCVERLLGVSKHVNSSLWGRMGRMLLTFVVVSLGWIFFRAASLNDAVHVVNGIFTNMAMPFKQWSVVGMSFLTIALAMLKDVVWECNGRYKHFVKNNAAVKFVFTVLVICFILLLGVLNSNQFIYFQF